MEETRKHRLFTERGRVLVLILLEQQRGVFPVERGGGLLKLMKGGGLLRSS